MRFHEQDLIDRFLSIVESVADEDIRLRQTISANCRARTAADIEYVSESGCHWVIEAKTAKSPDRHNGAHKLFGELLKEQGRIRQSSCRFGVLICNETTEFYQRKFAGYDPRTLLAFGALIPISRVFVLGDCLDQMTWREMIADSHQT